MKLFTTSSIQPLLFRPHNQHRIFNSNSPTQTSLTKLLLHRPTTSFSSTTLHHSSSPNTSPSPSLPVPGVGPFTPSPIKHPKQPSLPDHQKRPKIPPQQHQRQQLKTQPTRMFTPKEEEEVVKLSTPFYRLSVIVSHFNCRLFVLRYELLSTKTPEETTKSLEKMYRALQNVAEEKKVTKIVCKIRASQAQVAWPRLSLMGVVKEAVVPGFFSKGEEAWVLSYFVEKKRLQRPNFVKEQEDNNLKLALEAQKQHQQQQGTEAIPKLSEGYTTEFLDSYATAQELGAFYSKVFSSYPYPIDDPNFLLSSTKMNPDTKTLSLHRVIRRNVDNQIVAAVGADVDMEEMNAEVTDFGTSPSERGKGFASFLISAMEEDLRKHVQVFDYFAVVRAASFPMIKTFVNNGYKYGGTLCNNSCIGSTLPEIKKKGIKEEDFGAPHLSELSTMHIFAKPTKRAPSPYQTPSTSEESRKCIPPVRVNSR